MIGAVEARRLGINEETPDTTDWRQYALGLAVHLADLAPDKVAEPFRAFRVAPAPNLANTCDDESYARDRFVDGIIGLLPVLWTPS